LIYYLFLFFFWDIYPIKNEYYSKWNNQIKSAKNKTQQKKAKKFYIIFLLTGIILLNFYFFHKKSSSIKDGKFIEGINYTDFITNYFDKLPLKYNGEKNHELGIFRKYLKLKALSVKKNSTEDQKAIDKWYRSLGGKKYS